VIKKILNKIWGVEGQEDIKNSVDKKAEFQLIYSSQPIGYLTWSEGVWHFRYSNEFKLQQEIQPLIDFPNKDEKYESQFLWPFFSYRIPGLNQPAVKHIIKRDHVETNEVELLKKFRRNSIYNPFLLQPA
jgi:HipA-like protein